MHWLQIGLFGCLAGLGFAADPAAMADGVAKHSLKNGMTVITVARAHSDRIAACLAVAPDGAWQGTAASSAAFLWPEVIRQGTKTLGLKPGADPGEEERLIGVTERLRSELAHLEGESRAAERARRLQGSPIPAPKPAVGELRKELERAEAQAAALALPNGLDQALSRLAASPLQTRVALEGIFLQSTFPRDRLREWVDLMASAIAAPRLRNFHRTLQAKVLGEKTRSTSSLNRLDETLMALAFAGTPTWLPGEIGPAGLGNVRRSDVAEFHRKWITPGRITLVLVGDIDWPTLQPELQASFGSWQVDGSMGSLLAPIPPEMNGERRFILDAEAPAPAFEIGWQVPATGHSDHAAIDMLAGILGLGRSSRLHRDLVDSAGIASQAQVEVRDFIPGEAALLTLSVQAKGDSGTGELGTGIVRNIEQLRATEPLQEELDRVVALRRLEAARISEDPERLALSLASASCRIGDPGGFTHRVTRLQGVTPAEVRQAAVAYLNEANRTIGALRRPKDLADMAEAKEIDEKIRAALLQIIGRQIKDEKQLEDALMGQMTMIRRLPLAEKRRILAELGTQLRAPESKP